mgnify:CR=1 FL=1
MRQTALKGLCFPTNSLSRILDSYNIHMAKYFLSGEYECREKGSLFQKENTIVLVVQCVQKNTLQKYKQYEKS